MIFLSDRKQRSAGLQFRQTKWKNPSEGISVSSPMGHPHLSLSRPLRLPPHTQRQALKKITTTPLRISRPRISAKRRSARSTKRSFYVKNFQTKLPRIRLALKSRFGRDIFYYKLK